MRQRGRKSAEGLATAVVVDVSRRMPAPPPPELSDAQAAVWRDVVGSMPSNFCTRAAHPILIALCRHTCRSRLLEMQIAHFEVEWTRADGGLERLDRMLKMAERETAAMIRCSRALRISPQAIMHPRTMGRAIDALPSGPRPWD
jgi:hypothetical protein